MIVETIKRLVAGNGLTEEESEAFLGAVMEGKASDAQIAAVLALLARKGETSAEITGFVRAMRSKALPIPYTGDVMDLCGTGGDGAGTINISTAASFVAAACGVTVAKHGNRAATSKSGGADVLEALGLVLEAPPEKLAAALAKVGICFLFARSVHPAMRFVAPARSALGVRTVFNMLGPLTNPLSPRFQLIGVFSPRAAPPMAEALARLGCERAWLVHGEGGLDEISPAGRTGVWAVEGGEVRQFDVSPQDFGFPVRPLDAVRGGSPADNARILRGVFEGEAGPPLEAVAMNAGAALVIAGKARDPRDGAAQALAAIRDGRAAARLEWLIEFMRA